MSEIAYFEVTYADGRKEVKRVPKEALDIIEAVLAGARVTTFDAASEKGWRVWIPADKPTPDKPCPADRPLVNTCPDCGGRGLFDCATYPDASCPTCHGKGTVPGGEGE